MPAWTAVIRLLRRRIVLGVIFAVSFTYCALSLFQHEKKAALVENDSDDDQLYFSTDKPYFWQMQALSAEGDEDKDQDTALTLNNSDPLRNNCRNSIQGKALIVDERGLVCTRSEVLPSGCCSTEVLTLLDGDPNRSEASTPISIERERYSCQTCNSEGCCAIFEYCVSCCLHPGRAASNKVAKDPEKKSGHDQNRRLKRAEEGGRAEVNAIRHRLRTLDRFQVCLATCRTSSASVRHENTYKDPHSKYCYNLLSQNVNYNQRFRRDLNHIVTINNNNSQRKAALPPFYSFHACIRSSTLLVIFITEIHSSGRGIGLLPLLIVIQDNLVVAYFWEEQEPSERDMELKSWENPYILIEVCWLQSKLHLFHRQLMLKWVKYNVPVGTFGSRLYLDFGKISWRLPKKKTKRSEVRVKHNTN